MALDIDPVQLELDHTKSWCCRLGMFLGSLVERNWVVALVKIKILMEIGDHPMEEELRQSLHPHALF